MEQEPVVESFEDQINYPKAFMGAIIGAAIGIVGWAILAYLDRFTYFSPLGIGMFAGMGAASGAGRGNHSVAMIGLTIGALGIFIGDFIETAILVGDFKLSPNSYMMIMRYKIIDSNYWRIVLYLISIGVAYILGRSDPNYYKKNRKKPTS